MKNTKKNFATFSVKNLNSIKKLDNNQMNSLVGGGDPCKKKWGIVPVPDVSW